MKLSLQKVSLLLLVLSAFSFSAIAQLNGGVISSASVCASSSAPAPELTNSTSPSGGTAPYIYQWEAKIEYSFWTNIVSVGNGLSLQPGNLSYPTEYRRKVTDANGVIAYSNVIKLFTTDSYSAGSISLSGYSPIDLSETIPTIITSEAQAGSNAYSYAWEMSSVGPSGPWNPIAGQFGLTYQPTSLGLGSWYFRKKATDLNCGNVAYTSAIKIEIVASLPLNPTYFNYFYTCFYPNNAPSNFEGVIPRGGVKPYSYTWEKKEVGAANWSIISGANDISYQSPILSASTSFRRKTTDASGASAYTDGVLISLANNIPNPGAIASNLTSIAPNAPLTAIVETQGISNILNPVGYVWQQSTNGGNTWSDIVNYSYSIYFPESAPTVTTCYRRSIREACASTGNRDTWTNTVCINPATPLTDGTISLGTGSGACITPSTSPGAITGTPATGGATPYTYKWQKFDGIDFIDIPSTNTVSYNPGLLNASTKFRRIVTDGNGTSLTSNEVSVTIASSATLKGGIIDGPIITCSNTAPGIISNIIDACGGGGVFTYGWELNTGSGWNPISGASQATYNAPAIAGDTKFRRKVGDGCGSTVYSNEVPVYVYPAIEPGTISPATQNVCYNQVPELLGLTQNCHYTNGNVTYQWQRSASAAGPFTNISGAGQPVYLPKMSNISSYYRLVVTSSVCNAQAISNVSAVIVNTGCSVSGRVGSGGINTNDNALASNLSGRGNMKLYPNPVQKGQIVFINFDGDGANTKATLRGTDGRTYTCTIAAAARGALQVKMPANVAQGTYLIQLSNGQKQWVERIIIF